MKVYIVSITNVATGGTELLQQLCSALREKGCESFMYYRGNDYAGSVVEGRFGWYNNPYVEVIDDASENVVLVAESMVHDLYLYKNIKKYIWWLSVDNYYGSLKKSKSKICRLSDWLKDKINYYVLFKNAKHLVQSHYAYDYLINRGIDCHDVSFLTDYISDKIVGNVVSSGEVVCKENIVIYNPKKGMEVTSVLIEELSDYKFVALENMDTSELIDLMRRSKVYIDFGNHPGKDRLPRETALFNCCIVTNRTGSANYFEDVGIPSDYKFIFENTEIELIVDKIKSCICDYESHVGKFHAYRNKILKEKSEFELQVGEFLHRNR